MSELTMQRYFTETVEYLRGQETKAAKGGVCFYLTEDGNKCAIGRWIPDGHEGQGHGRGADSLAVTFPDLAGVAWPNCPTGVSLADHLQGLHDDQTRRYRVGLTGGGLSPEGESRAELIARIFGLEYMAPQVTRVTA